MEVFLILLIIVLGALFVKYIAHQRAHHHAHREVHDVSKESARALAETNKERHDAFLSRVDKAFELFSQKETITNNDLENELGVSDATATRYLQELERMGKIEQIGRRGRYTHYRKQ